jgi:hypothetical protein
MLGNQHVSVRWGEVGALEIQDLASYPTPFGIGAKNVNETLYACNLRSLDRFSQLIITQLSGSSALPLFACAHPLYRPVKNSMQDGIRDCFFQKIVHHTLK